MGLVEVNVVEQRYRGVTEVLDQGATVTDVAARYGVTRQTLQNWIRRYRQGRHGWAGEPARRPSLHRWEAVRVDGHREALLALAERHSASPVARLAVRIFYSTALWCGEPAYSAS